MKNKLLVQDNALTMARYEMTSLEKNIMYAVMAQIEDTDTPTKCYKISLTDISNLTKRRVRNDDFKAAVQRLLTRDFSIKDSGGYLQSTFIASAYYDNRGFVEIEIGIKLRPYLFALKKNFTTFGIEAATSLNSKYAKRLYEMLCQFKSTGFLRISTHELKERFQLLNDDGSEKFQQWINFETKVLKVAQVEINEKTEFQFDYVLKKEGRKITTVEFVFRKTESATKAESVVTVPMPIVKDVVALNARMLERFTNYGLTTDQVVKIIAKHTEKAINKQLYELDCNKATVKNTAAYLLKIFGI